jgi:2-polyprenyl-3-methyl-5-hydroxy-6-metoxy-1,4-benzoquinol methylase
MMERHKAVLEQVEPTDNVLDIGVVQHDSDYEKTENWLHKHLDRKCIDILGIDILPDEIEKLQERGYNVQVADAEQFDLPDTYDTIVAGELIEHLSNPGDFLDNCYNHLRPGGELILTTPNVWGIVYLKRLAFPGEVNCNPEHTCWYDSRTLRQFLERHGYEVDVSYIKPEPVSPTSLPELSWKLGSKRLGAISLLAVARKGDSK